MKWGTRNFLLMLSTVLLVLSTNLTAQDSAHRRYPHYKVIDTGTLGVPNSHINLGGHPLNNAGALTVSADLPDTDPYSPDGPSTATVRSPTSRYGRRASLRILV